MTIVSLFARATPLPAFNAAQVKARLAAFYNTTDIEVNETRTLDDVTYFVSFVRTKAGTDFAQLAWDGERSHLVARQNASANVLTGTGVEHVARVNLLTP